MKKWKIQTRVLDVDMVFTMMKYILIFAICIPLLALLILKLIFKSEIDIWENFKTMLDFAMVIFTLLYVIVTMLIVKKNSESIEATKEFSRATVDIEKSKLTFEIIKDWYQLKIRLENKLENIPRNNSQGNESINRRKINYCIAYYDYFNLMSS